MLSFFRVNAFYQIGTLLFLLLAIRLPLYLSGIPLLIPELQWMLTGEQMNKGLMLYADIWDSTAPLAAMVYAAIDGVVGRSHFTYLLVALAFSVFQIIYFNQQANRRNLFGERGYLPGLMYMLFLNISFDCFTLSPALMATTFLLLAFNTLIRQMDRQGATDEVFEIGFYISVATLFHPPSFLFLLWAVASLLLFTGASIRQHSLMIFGFLFPLLLTALFFYLDGNYDSFTRNFVGSVFQIRQYVLNDFRTLLLVFLMPALFTILGFLRVTNSGRFGNFQIRCQQIMALYFIAGILSFVLTPFLAPMQFVIFVPCIAFFWVHFFNSFRKKWAGELVFFLFFCIVLLFEYQAVYPSLQTEAVATLNNLRLKPAKLPKEITDKRIIILGDGMSEYLNNYPATPYLNWSLARYDLENLDRYENVINILKNFDQDPPEYIIDRQQIVPKLFQRIPALSRRYKKVEENVYRRVG
ncbi:MAG: hypothetical protein U0Y10_15035 [Spirosomataceae bacterium]